MTRPALTGRSLLTAGIVGLVVSLLVWSFVARGGGLVPAPPVLAAILLVVMGVAVLVVAWPIRRYLKGRATTRLDPLRATRALVLAQAGAITGALVVGWYAGALALTLVRLSLEVSQVRSLQLGAMVALGGLLIGAGMLAQSWCRFDPPEEDDQDEGDDQYWQH